MTTITALPAPPSRDDPSNFAARGDAWNASLVTFTTQVNAVGAEVSAASGYAEDAVAAAGTAEAAAANALAVANASMWVSGTTYAIGDARYSPVDLQTYRRKTSGAGTTDPSLDNVNWAGLGTSLAQLQATALLF